MQSLNRYPYHLNEFNNKDINSFVVILIFLKLLLSCPVGMGNRSDVLGVEGVSEVGYTFRVLTS